MQKLGLRGIWTVRYTALLLKVLGSDADVAELVLMLHTPGTELKARTVPGC